jgi:hypothetical protein
MALRWDDREVTFADFTIKEGRAVRAAFARGDSEAGSYICLIASARYADTGEPVFRSVEEIEALPFRLTQRVMRLASEAAKVNGMLDDEDGERVANGSGEAAGPSH